MMSKLNPKLVRFGTENPNPMDLDFYTSIMSIGTSSTTISKLQCIQNQLARTVARTPSPARSNHFQCHNCLTGCQLLSASNTEWLNSIKEQAPSHQPVYLWSLQHPSVAGCTLHSSAAPPLYMQRTRTKFSKQAGICHSSLEKSTA